MKVFNRVILVAIIGLMGCGRTPEASHPLAGQDPDHCRQPSLASCSDTAVSVARYRKAESGSPSCGR